MARRILDTSAKDRETVSSNRRVSWQGLPHGEVARRLAAQTKWNEGQFHLLVVERVAGQAGGRANASDVTGFGFDHGVEVIVAQDALLLQTGNSSRQRSIT